jgi:hypothetical protein
VADENQAAVERINELLKRLGEVTLETHRLREELAKQARQARRDIRMHSGTDDQPA